MIILVKKNQYRDYSLRNKPITDEEARFFFDHYYQDRGMLKWQGFFLSDHKAAMEQEDNQPIVKPREQQTMKFISKKLKLSWEYKRPAIIQLQSISTNDVLEQVEGIVQGFTANRIIIKDNEDQLHEVELENIRNCRVN